MGEHGHSVEHLEVFEDCEVFFYKYLVGEVLIHVGNSGDFGLLEAQVVRVNYVFVDYVFFNRKIDCVGRKVNILECGEIMAYSCLFNNEFLHSTCYQVVRSCRILLLCD